jgi:hypothetical protein
LTFTGRLPLLATKSTTGLRGELTDESRDSSGGRSGALAVTPDQFVELLNGGRETRAVEFTAAGPRGDPLVFAFVARAVLAMSNLPLGGWILLGVQDDGQMSGLSESEDEGEEHRGTIVRVRGRSRQDTGL